MALRYHGVFVTIEGVDGAGKTTVLENIRNLLVPCVEKGGDVVFTREPGGTPFGELIRSNILTHRGDDKPNATTELLCMLASRIHHLEHLIMPSLKNNDIVVCSRFNDSTRVLQGILGDKGELIQELSKLKEFRFLCQRPDITLFIDVDDKIAAERMKLQGDDDRLGEKWLQFENASKAWRSHMRMAEMHPTVGWGPSKIIWINGDQSKEAVIAECMDKLKQALAYFYARAPLQHSFYEVMKYN